MVSITDSSSQDPKGYVSSQGFSWTFGVSETAMKLYDVQGLPTTFFISRDGDVVDKVVGGLESADLERRVQKLLEKTL